MIKHEDKPNGVSSLEASADAAFSGRRQTSDRKDGQTDKGDKSVGSSTDAPMKKKRLHEKLQSNSQQAHPRLKDASSSLSSAPASPPRSRHPSSHPHSDSDSDRAQIPKSPKHSVPPSKDRLKPPEKLVPHKRKAPKAESDDEAESRKARRMRLASAGGDRTSHSPSKASKDSTRIGQGSAAGSINGSGPTPKLSASRNSRDTSQNRSISPQPRGHRRSTSTHLPSQSNGLGQKKKRVPAPLQSTDYNSDESSASGSPHVRSAKLRSLATPATTESAISPAKMGPHKKHLDAHGQTFLARACARGEVDLAKQRLQERPEDLNVADFAGNTPLQIAAINGYGEIVKFLIDAGCNLDCVNYDRDTPLLDAVDNGHLEVVKLLLDAGVNPRKANVNGEEPLDRVNEDVENAAEIRAALVEAKKKTGGRRLTSEEHHHENDDFRLLQGPESPRRSPAPPGANARRAGTVRATKTSNHLLYMPMDDKTLRLAAGRGDEQNVIRILQVREAFDDPESMVAASRGGHDVVIQLLLALGKANPDPPPISSTPPEHATPILAAIGQENIKVIRLLLDQTNFDPTKRFNGQTYYEVARQRAGPNWKEEEDILKKAYDNYKKTHGGKTKSPVRKEGEPKKLVRSAEVSEDASSRLQKRRALSPTRERLKKAVTSGKGVSVTTGVNASLREEKGSQKRASDHSASHGDGKSEPKRIGSTSGPSTKQKSRDDRNSVSPKLDRDTPPPSKQANKPKRAEADTIAVSSEGEALKPRRKKLISGRELKDEKVREKERERERDKQRRASMASAKGSTSPRETRQDDPSERVRAEKHRDRDRDRARQLKREESKESISGTATDGSGKRHRLSETPPNAASSDKDTNEAPVKRRRLDADGSGAKEKKLSKGSTSPDGAPSKTSASATSKSLQKRRDEDDRKASAVVKAKKREASSDRGRKDSVKASGVTEKIIHVKSEDIDIVMTDVSPGAQPPSATHSTTADADAKVQREKEDEKRKKLEAADTKKKEEELQRRRQEEEEEKRKKEEKRKREEEEAKRKEEEEKKKIEEEEKQRERKRLEDEERKRKEEERKRNEEEEKKRREEEEEKRRRGEERKRQLEEERKKREEEERLRQEQLEREAAEEARRKREEEERKKREREEQERVRAEKEAEEHRRKLEEERIRVAKLPPVLRWLSASSNPKSAGLAKLFKTMQGVRYDCIDVASSGSPEGREQWLMNTQVALILGEKDLSLSQYRSWRRLPVSMIAKRIIWRLECDRYSLTDPDLFDIGTQLSDYYGTEDPDSLGTLGLERLRREAWEKFSSTDMFFVKVCLGFVLPKLVLLVALSLTSIYRYLM